MIRITKSEKNAETNTIRMANSHYFKGEEDAVDKYRNSLILLVPETGLEPVRSFGTRDFKSLASANSATPAVVTLQQNQLLTTLPEVSKGVIRCQKCTHFADTLQTLLNSLLLIISPGPWYHLISALIIFQSQFNLKGVK